MNSRTVTRMVAWLVCLTLLIGLTLPVARAQDGETSLEGIFSLLHPGQTPLHWAVSTGNAGTVTALLKAGADPGVRTENGETPLHWAAFLNSDAGAITAALLKAGADPAARDKNGKTPLHRASSTADIIALLKAGADPAVRDQFGWTPLHRAASEGDAGDIIVLLKAGADPGARTGYDGWTPLHYAARNGHAGVITALLEAGADPGARDKDGRAPLDLIPEESPLIGTSAYWTLKDARWD